MGFIHVMAKVVMKVTKSKHMLSLKAFKMNRSYV